MQCGTGRFRRVNISCDEFSTDFDLVNIIPESGGCNSHQMQNHTYTGVNGKPTVSLRLNITM